MVKRDDKGNEIGSGKKRKSFGKVTGDWQGFIDIPLKDADKERVQGDIGEGLFKLEEALLDFIEDGYKVSITGDYAHGAIIVAVTGRSEDCENKGWTLSGRGPDVLGATAVLWYKVYTLAEGGPWAAVAAKENQLPLWG